MKYNLSISERSGNTSFYNFGDTDIVFFILPKTTIGQPIDQYFLPSKQTLILDFSIKMSDLGFRFLEKESGDK